MALKWLSRTAQSLCASAISLSYPLSARLSSPLATSSLLLSTLPRLATASGTPALFAALIAVSGTLTVCSRQSVGSTLPDPPPLHGSMSSEGALSCPFFHLAITLHIFFPGAHPPLPSLCGGVGRDGEDRGRRDQAAAGAGSHHSAPIDGRAIARKRLLSCDASASAHSPPSLLSLPRSATRRAVPDAAEHHLHPQPLLRHRPPLHRTHLRHRPCACG